MRRSLQEALLVLSSMGIAGTLEAATTPSNEEDHDGTLGRPVEELFLGTVPFSQDQLELQMTTGGIWQHHGGTDSLTLPLVFEFGVTDRLSVELEAPVLFQFPGSDGLSNAELGLLWNFFSSRPLGLSMATGLALGFPAPAASVPAQAYFLEPWFAVYKIWGPVHFNLSGGPEVEFPLDRDLLPGETSETEVEGEAAFAALVPFGPLIPLVEVSAQFDDEASAVSAGPGLLCHPGLDLELGLATTVGLTPAAPDFAAHLLLTWEVELGDDDD